MSESKLKTTSGLSLWLPLSPLALHRESKHSPSLKEIGYTHWGPELVYPSSLAALCPLQSADCFLPC